MFDSMQHDVTPVGSYSSAVEMRQAAFTPLPERPSSVISKTAFVQFSDDVVFSRIYAATDMTGSFNSPAEGGSVQLLAVDAVMDVVSKTANDRGVLLARKYAGSFDREETSRLEILTARLRKLSPRVSSGELDALSEMIGGMESVNLRLATIQERYSAL